MLHPTIVNIVSFFYPIGNTPAVCLTQDLPREQEADILLLGCGDVRNILFTIYSDNGSSLSSKEQVLRTRLTRSRIPSTRFYLLRHRNSHSR